MRIYDGLEAPGLQRTPRVLAVGAYDGVHRGHQRLLGHVCRIASEYGITSAVMTLEPIPAQVFRRHATHAVRLTTSDERSRELQKQCVDEAVVVAFDEQLRNMSALDFAREILVERLGVTVLVASKTHTFGRNAEADVQRIAELGMELGFEVHVLPPILVDGQLINSTQIRTLLWEGGVETAAKLLGRPYDLAGKVVSGRGLGRKLGFPTANLQPPPEKLIPGDAVYACAARLEAPGQEPSAWHPAAVSIGCAPTLGDQPRALEAFFLDADLPDLGDTSVRLLFLRRLRDQVKFPDLAALTAQIERDAATVREVFATAPPWQDVSD
jgi:riboflavin kinase/FMN adenylyltransferase